MERKQRGFTIVELTLAVAFIAILLLLIAFVTIKAGQLYEKGNTIRGVNQMGREVMDVLRRDIVQSGSKLRFVTVSSDKTRSFRLCLNGVSYVANSATLLLESSSTKKVTYEDKPIALTRIVDPAGAFCDDPAGSPQMRIIASHEPRELLRNDDIELAVHDFSVRALATDREQSLYEVRMTIGTNQAGTVDEDVYCRPNASSDNANKDANFNYCSIAEFSTIVRAGGTS